VIPRAIAAGAILLGLGRAWAQMPTDAAAAIAVTAEQEKAMAGEARSVTRSAIGVVFGSGQGASPGAAPSVDAQPAEPVPANGGVPPLAAIPPNAAMPRQADVPPSDGAPALDNLQDSAAVPDGAAPVEGEAAAALALRGRDPFRPFTLDLRPDTHESELLTPLQRYELPQLRLAGVVLELLPPRAMLQDNSGMGYIVIPGTPIGRRHGVVKSIEPRRVVVEEHVIDYYGREQTHQVVIEMAKDDKPQSAIQE
jgi:Pilus assembly protein, PilP